MRAKGWDATARGRSRWKARNHKLDWTKPPRQNHRVVPAWWPKEPKHARASEVTKQVKQNSRMEQAGHGGGSLGGGGGGFTAATPEHPNSLPPLKRYKKKQKNSCRDAGKDPARESKKALGSLGYQTQPGSPCQSQSQSQS